MHGYALWCKVPQQTPHKLLKNREIQITDLSENPRVSAERGPPSADQFDSAPGHYFMFLLTGDIKTSDSKYSGAREYLTYSING